MSTRTHWPFLRDRRIDAYGDLDQTLHRLSRDDTAGQGRVWITGAGGLIGSYLVRLAGKYAPLSSHPADPRRFGFDRLRRRRAEIPGRASAPGHSLRRDVQDPDCQANPAQARKINVEATALLAAWRRSADFIFFSTDLVFDGRKGNYVETDAVNPLSVYGETKVEAEASWPNTGAHLVVRTSLNSGLALAARAPTTSNSRRLGGRKNLKLFHDEYRSPISAAATARAVWELAA
jgi:dTDP-4-dehydrorhamnose reductase